MKKDRPWAGADTETYKGKVILLCVIGCSEGHWFRRKYFKRSLHGYLEALLEFAGFNVAFFNLSYDIEALLAMLPAKSRDKFRLDKTQTVSVNGDKYKMSWIPGKEFVLRKDKLIVRCYDMYQYFHKSLDAVSKDLFDEGKIEIPEEWLLNMQKAMDENFDKVVKYCHKDARLVMRIAEHLQIQFAAVNVSFNRPLSCGTLARLHFTLPREVPMRENRLFEKVYYGGRFEILARGTFHDVCYADINSAYPAEIAKLQDISECSFATVRADVVPTRENWNWYAVGLAYGMYKVSVYIPPDRNICPIAQYAPYDPEMPQNALVYFPAGIYTTWVDKHTLQILLEEYCITDFHTGFEYRINKEKKAFPGIEEMYKRRKAEPNVSYALKILMNSLYGKLCQKDSRWFRNNILTSQTYMRDGKPYVRKDRFTPFTCLAYASHITGAVRATVYEAAKETNAFAIMTDAIIFPLDNKWRMGSDELGEWKFELLDKVTILGNGWYIYYHKDGRVTSHCRGIRGQVDLEALLKKLGRKKVWETKMRQRVSIAQAAVRPKLRLFVNEILDMPKRLRLNMDTKRCWPADMRAQDFLNRQQFSDPWILVD